MKTPVQYSTSFSSVEELAETSGFELGFCQLEAGIPSIKMKATVLSSIICNEFSINKAFHQQGTSPTGYASFGIMQGDSISRWAGKDIGLESLIDFNARSGFECKSDGLFTAKNILVQGDRLQESAEVLGIDVSKLGDNEYAQTRVVHAHRLRQLQFAIRNAERLVPVLMHQSHINRVVESFEDNIYQKLADCLEGPHQWYSKAQLNQFGAMRRAIEYIKSHARESITVTDLCRNSACTSRTLERVFRREFGVTPTKYIKLIKIAGVRKDLQQSGQEMSIKHAALS